MSEILKIGNKREMFWDDYLVDRSRSDTRVGVCPLGEGVQVGILDNPIISYPTIVKTDEEYRIYYIAGSMDTEVMMDNPFTMHLGVRVITSKDGIHWETPCVPGRNDNVVIESILDNVFVYRDINPDCPKEELYKAVASGLYDHGKYGLYMLVSADGYAFHSPRMITNKGFFDTMNTLHYIDGRYVCYIRSFHPYKPPKKEADCMLTDFMHTNYSDWGYHRMRSICVTYSEDGVNWTDPEELIYNDDEDHEMYTNNAMVYERAPHLMIGFPTRYCERVGWNENFAQMEGLERRLRAYHSDNPREALTITDCLFMFSRDTKTWTRYSEAFVSPGYEDDKNWVYGDCYMAFGFIDSGREHYMMYTHSWHQDHNLPKPLVMYKVRKDGFACHSADATERCLVTKPLIYEGGEMHLNFTTSAYGHIIMDLLDEAGNVIPGTRSYEVFGNHIDRRVIRADGGDYSPWSGKVVRLRFRMRDAKLYSLKFEKTSEDDHG